MEQTGITPGRAAEVSENYHKCPIEAPHAKLRKARTKLPAEIKKKIEEWKFSSGALVVCLVAFSDGKDVQGFQ